MKRWLTVRFFVLGTAAFLMGLFIKLTSELREGEVDAFDQALLTRIVHLRVQALNGPAVDITALGSPTVLTLFVSIGLLFFILKRHWREARYLLLGTLGIPIWSTGMKQLFTRPRPPNVEHLVQVTSYSYPSGHSVASTAFYLLVATLVSRQFTDLRACALTFAIAWMIIGAIGFSRMYLGVHYPSDVLSGFFLGSAWALLVTGVFYSKDTKKKAQS